MKSIRYSALLFLLLTGCATGRGGEPPVLEETIWRIVLVDGQEVERGGELNLTPHFRILSADGRIHGATGCNRFSGNYQATGTMVSFGPMVSTRSVCPDPGRQWVEDHILDVLDAADAYRMEDGWLWLYSGGQVRLTAEVW